MNARRNLKTRPTTGEKTAAAKRRILAALAAVGGPVPLQGHSVFSGHASKAPKAASRNTARLMREMEAQGLVQRAAGAQGYEITPTGRRALAFGLAFLEGGAA